MAFFIPKSWWVLCALGALTGCVSKNKYRQSLQAIEAAEQRADAHTKQLADAKRDLTKLRDEYDEYRILADEAVAKGEAKLVTLMDSVQALAAQLEAKSAQVQQLIANGGSFDKNMTARLQKLDELEQQSQKTQAQNQRLEQWLRDSLQAAYPEVRIERSNGRVVLSVPEKLLFKPSSKSLDRNGRELLGRLYPLLAASEWHVLAIGYSGSARDESANRELGQERALAVVETWLERGLDKNRLHSLGRGKRPFPTDPPPPADEVRWRNHCLELLFVNGAPF